MCYEGTTHGVYVLPTSTGNVENCMLSSCLEVLQKPNYLMMQSKGALRTSGNCYYGIRSYVSDLCKYRNINIKEMERNMYTQIACFGADQDLSGN